MRIKSNFKDYYDSIQSYGQNQDFVYKRFPQTLKTNRRPLFYSTRIQFPRSISSAINIGFCGNMYFGIKLETYNNGQYDTNILWSTEDVDKFVQKYCNKKETYEYFNYKPRFRFSDNFLKKSIQDMFNLSEDFYQRQSYDFLFLDNYAPIFYHIQESRFSRYSGDQEIVLNGNIGQFDFVRLFDPYQAYQEISMYLGNMAVPLKPIPKIDDKTMAEAKGFDKFSFRKDKKG